MAREPSESSGATILKQGFVTMRAIGNYGRLANGMYQIAGILGIGRKNNLEPVFPPWINADHRDRFGSQEDVDLQKYFVHELPGIPEGLQWQPERPIPWGYSDVRLPPGNWNLSGHFQSWRYFDYVRDTVSHYFRMKDEPEQNDYIAVHFRGADYDNAYHPRLDMSYYRRAMDLFPLGKFLIFTDTPGEAREMFGSDVEYSEGRDYIQDFKLMKRCKDFIIGNSSYSAMAATLGDHPEKRVVAPRPWFGKLYAGITGDDIYEPGWVTIQWDR
jgi:hypothetical protein